MKINKQILLDILYNNKSGKIEETITGHGRWCIYYKLIFEYLGKYYETKYSVGATECQDESPFEYSPEEVDCVEVHQVERLVKVWEPVDGTV